MYFSFSVTKLIKTERAVRQSGVCVKRRIGPGSVQQGGPSLSFSPYVLHVEQGFNSIGLRVCCLVRAWPRATRAAKTKAAESRKRKNIENSLREINETNTPKNTESKIHTFLDFPVRTGQSQPSTLPQKYKKIINFSFFQTSEEREKTTFQRF